MRIQSSTLVSNQILCTMKLTCHDACLECWGTSQNTCFSCKKGYQLINATCYPKCCDECIQCNQTLTTSTCQQCSKASTLLSNGKCLTICHPSCKNCSGWETTNCIECHPNFQLTSGKCVQICFEGCVQCNFVSQVCEACQNGYQLDSNGKCQIQCFNTCSICKGPQPNECTSCIDGFSLKNGFCEPTCDLSCGFCVGTASSQCSDCKQYYDLVDGKCTLSCQTPCKTCLDSPNKCTACISTTDYVYNEEAHTCTYNNSCHSSCSTCTGLEKYNCLTCQAGYFLEKGYCILKTDCDTYFSEIIGNLAFNLIDKTENDELFNISLQVYPKLNLYQHCFALDVYQIQQSTKVKRNYIVDNLKSAHYLELVLTKKDILELCIKKTDIIKEWYTCKFEIEVYNTTTNKTSFTFDYEFQKQFETDEFISYASQPVETLAPFKNASFKERIISEITLCDNCNCTSPKKNSIKVNEPIYVKQYLVDPNIYKKYSLQQNKIYIKTSYGEIQNFVESENKYCNSWILTDFGNTTKKVTVKECSEICYEKGTGLLTPNCSMSFSKYQPNQTVCICSSAFENESLNKTRKIKMQLDSTKCNNWHPTERGQYLGFNKHFCSLSCYKNDSTTVNNHCVINKADQDQELTLCICKSITCSSTCKLCVGELSIQCLECYEGYQLSNGSCIPICPEGCLSCTKNNRFSCKTCQPNYQLVDTKYCAPACSPYCMFCSNETCLQCSNNYIPKGNKCEMICPTGCSSCSEALGCIECKSGYTKDGTKCIASSGCHVNCSTCQGPAGNECLSCASPKILISGSCVTYQATTVNSFFTDLEIISHVEEVGDFGYAQQLALQFSKPYNITFVVLGLIIQAQDKVLEYVVSVSEQTTNIGLFFTYKDISSWGCEQTSLNYRCLFKITFTNESATIKEYKFQYVYEIDSVNGYATSFASSVILASSDFTEQIKYCISWKSEKESSRITQRYCEENCQDSVFKMLSNKCTLENTTSFSNIFCTCTDKATSITKKNYYKTCQNWQPTLKGILMNLTSDYCFTHCYNDQKLNSLDKYCAGNNEQYIEQTTLCECVEQLAQPSSSENDEDKYCAQTVGQGYTMYKGTFKLMDKNGSTLQAESFIKTATTSTSRLLETQIYENEIIITNCTDIKIISPESTEEDDDDDNHTVIIVIIVVCSTVGIFTIIIILYCLFKGHKRTQVDSVKQNKKQQQDSQKKPLKLNEESEKAADQHSVGNKKW